MIVELSKPVAGYCWLEATNRHMRAVNACKGDEERLKQIIPIEAHGFHVKAEWAAAVWLGYTMPKRLVRTGRLALLIRCLTGADVPFACYADEPDRVLIWVRGHNARQFEVVGWTTVHTCQTHGTRTQASSGATVCTLADEQLWDRASFPAAAVGLHEFNEGPE